MDVTTIRPLLESETKPGVVRSTMEDATSRAVGPQTKKQRQKEKKDTKGPGRPEVLEDRSLCWFLILTKNRYCGHKAVTVDSDGQPYVVVP